MVNYPNTHSMNPVFLNNQGNGDRFVFPFLFGALAGGAAVGLSRPRPIYNVAPAYPYPAPYPAPYPVPYPQPYRPYTNVSYNYNSAY